MTAEPILPKSEVRGVGRVTYRCAGCGESLEPEDAMVVDGHSYHPDHLPEPDDGR